MPRRANNKHSVWFGVKFVYICADILEFNIIRNQQNSIIHNDDLTVLILFTIRTMATNKNLVHIGMPVCWAGLQSSKFVSANFLTKLPNTNITVPLFNISA